MPGVLQGKTAAVCSDNPPVKHNQDYCAVLQSQGAICSQEQITRDGLIVTARQKSPYFVAGVIEVIAQGTVGESSAVATADHSGVQELAAQSRFSAPC